MLAMTHVCVCNRMLINIITEKQNTKQIQQRKKTITVEKVLFQNIKNLRINSAVKMHWDVGV